MWTMVEVEIFSLFIAAVKGPKKWTSSRVIYFHKIVNCFKYCCCQAKQFKSFSTEWQDGANPIKIFTPQDKFTNAS